MKLAETGTPGELQRYVSASAGLRTPVDSGRN
jgi:hypothetical protein